MDYLDVNFVLFQLGNSQSTLAKNEAGRACRHCVDGEFEELKHVVTTSLNNAALTDSASPSLTDVARTDITLERLEEINLTTNNQPLTKYIC